MASLSMPSDLPGVEGRSAYSGVSSACAESSSGRLSPVVTPLLANHPPDFRFLWQRSAMMMCYELSMSMYVFF